MVHYSIFPDAMLIVERYRGIPPKFSNIDWGLLGSNLKMLYSIGGFIPSNSEKSIYLVTSIVYIPSLRHPLVLSLA
jgi:hypothetical protein